jgi:hypothetical protein
MKQPEYILNNGTQVRTHDKLGKTTGMLTGPGNMSMRKPSSDGVIRGVVAGHGGDVYWVQHPGDTLYAPYCFDEIELAGGAA